MSFSLTSRVAVAILVAALGVTILPGCGPSGIGQSVRSEQSARTGHALAGQGAQLGGGLVFFDTKAGSEYYLGFPQFVNTSSARVHVLRVKLSGIAPNVDVVRYLEHSTRQYGGRAFLAYDPTKPIRGLNFYGPRSLSGRYWIAPHVTSDRYAMAEVRITTPRPQLGVKYCNVFYAIGGSKGIYKQQFQCQFQFGAPRH